LTKTTSNKNIHIKKDRITTSLYLLFMYIVLVLCYMIGYILFNVLVCGFICFMSVIRLYSSILEIFDKLRKKTEEDTIPLLNDNIEPYRSYIEKGIESL
jgi:hypothetical protein